MSSPYDEEIEAMRVAYAALAKHDRAARSRMLEWLISALLRDVAITVTTK